MKAIWNGVVIAESNQTVVVEGNHYFPPDSIRDEVTMKSSQTTSVCPWKGTASYHDVVVDGKVNKDAAWSYPNPKKEASNIKGHLAFWKGVTVAP